MPTRRPTPGSPQPEGSLHPGGGSCSFSAQNASVVLIAQSKTVVLPWWGDCKTCSFFSDVTVVRLSYSAPHALIFLLFPRTRHLRAFAHAVFSAGHLLPPPLILEQLVLSKSKVSQNLCPNATFSEKPYLKW